eukprot:6466222-Alexandrium_andersonii.AAC.1
MSVLRRARPWGSSSARTSFGASGSGSTSARARWTCRASRSELGPRRDERRPLQGAHPGERAARAFRS